MQWSNSKRPGREIVEVKGIGEMFKAKEEAILRVRNRKKKVIREEGCEITWVVKRKS